MNSIDKIDPNFKAISVNGHNLSFLPIDRAPFILSGLPWYEDEREFCRLPRALLPRANEGVRGLAWHTSGAVARFRTDTSTIGIQAVLRGIGDMSHMPRSGSAGFDLFEGTGPQKTFRANVRPDQGNTRIENIFCQNLPRKMREWTLYLPLYNGVEACRIGLDPDSTMELPSAHTFPKPVLFYGSSITQGGCASRPGNSCPAMVCRRLDTPMINWGFSGSGRGESFMAEAIASLDLGAFVMDYDHNAPTPEHLEATHEPFFQRIRQAHPTLPVILISRPDFSDNEPCRQRRSTIRKTFDNAWAEGDRNVYFIDGETLFGTTERDLCTVDGCHPNDIGFLRMADGITPVVHIALLSKKEPALQEPPRERAERQTP